MYFFDLSSLFSMQLIRPVAQRFILLFFFFWILRKLSRETVKEITFPLFVSHLPISILHRKIRCNYQSRLIPLIFSRRDEGK